jgi:hypothetical protein
MTGCGTIPLVARALRDCAATNSLVREVVQNRQTLAAKRRDDVSPARTGVPKPRPLCVDWGG